MLFDPEDPKWTAYVLGELDADARAEVEASLAASPDARRAVDEIRRTARLLATGLEAEPCPAPIGALIELPAVESELPADLDPLGPAEAEITPVVRPEGHTRFVGRLPWLAIAASLLVSFGLGAFLFSGGGQLRQAIVAMRLIRPPQKAPAPATPEVDTTLNDAETDDFVLEAADPQTSSSPAGAADLVLPLGDLPRMELHSDLKASDPSHAGLSEATGAAATTPDHGVDRPTHIYKPIYQTDKPIYQNDATTESPSAAAPGSPIPEAEQGSRGAVLGRYGGIAAGADSRTAEERRDLGVRTADQRPSAAPAGGSEQSKATNFAAGASRGEPANHFNGPVTWTDGSNSHKLNQAYLPPPESERKPADVRDNRIASPFNPHADEAYQPVTDNPFLPVASNPLSTFSIDVDTASYSIVRRYLDQNRRLPPPAAVRIEELVNYFPYAYPQPADGQPIAANVELAVCPWNAEHRLLRVGIKARDVAPTARPLTNLVFLVDVSGSMQSPDKLPLVKDSLRLLAAQMGENDHVAIVVYAGNSGLALPSTSGINQDAIRRALDALEAGGSTNGAGGIAQAYEVAQANFVKGGVNRVILATDGDFNVGITDRGELIKLIEQRAASGVFLTTLGFGMGNLKDATLEQLADKGNGNYAYIDNLREAKKVLVEQMSGTLVTVAKDVKLQIEFNPGRVAQFRLIGYENRILRHEEFNDDKKDAGDVGAGHCVTALYELVPAGEPPAAKAEAQPGVDPLKYQRTRVLTPAADSAELVTLKLRYKQPDADKSQLLEYPVKDSGGTFAQATTDFKFAAGVALFGMLLRDSPYKGSGTLEAAQELAQSGLGSDPAGYRSELIGLIGKAIAIKREAAETQHRE